MVIMTRVCVSKRTGLRKVRDCFLTLAQFSISFPPPVPDPPYPGVEFKRFRVTGDGLVPLLHFVVSLAAVCPVRPVVWHEFDGLGKVGRRLVGAAQPEVSPPAMVVVGSEGRIVW